MPLAETTADTCRYCSRPANVTFCHEAGDGAITYDLPVCNSHIARYLDDTDG